MILGEIMSDGGQYKEGRVMCRGGKIGVVMPPLFFYLIPFFHKYIVNNLVNGSTIRFQ